MRPCRPRPLLAALPLPGFMPIWGDGIFGHAGIHGGPYGVAG